MSDFTTILAIDSALQGCNVACVSGDVQASRSRAMAHGQAEHLVPMVQDVLQEAGIGFQDLECILTTVGPGAFTGLRIGLSAAKAFALSLDVPIYGITSLQALACGFAQADTGRSFSVVIESKRQDFYTQSFDERGVAVTEAAALMAKDIDIKEGVIIGDGCGRFADEIGGYVEHIEGYDRPDPLAMIAAFKAGPELFSDAVAPLYLKDADVSMPKNPPRRLQSLS